MAYLIRQFINQAGLNSGMDYEDWIVDDSVVSNYNQFLDTAHRFRLFTRYFAGQLISYPFAVGIKLDTPYTDFSVLPYWSTDGAGESGWWDAGDPSPWYWHARVRFLTGTNFYMTKYFPVRNQKSNYRFVDGELGIENTFWWMRGLELATQTIEPLLSSMYLEIWQPVNQSYFGAFLGCTGVQWDHVYKAVKLRWWISQRKVDPITVMVETIETIKMCRLYSQQSHAISDLDLGEFYPADMVQFLGNTLVELNQLISLWESKLLSTEGNVSPRGTLYMERRGSIITMNETIIATLKAEIVRIIDTILPQLGPDFEYQGVEYFSQGKARLSTETLDKVRSIVPALLALDFMNTKYPIDSVRFGGFVPGHPEIGP